MKTVYMIHHVRAIADLSQSLDGSWEIHRINVPVPSRGAGWGRAILGDLLRDADREHATLWLLPMASGGLTQNQLVSWYQRHGFVWDGEPQRSKLIRRSV